jgi:AcrR family transcriptional regulator
MIAEARRLVVDHGYAGFTIERLCELVGVSRRTFFNHFASKEDVVLGFAIGESDAVLERFAAAPVPDGLSPLDAVLDATIEHLHHVGIDRDENRLVRAVLEREPALVARLLAATDVELAKYAAALARRYGWGPDDRRARVTIELAAALMKVTAARFFDESDPAPFDELLRESRANALAVIDPHHDLETSA